MTVNGTRALTYVDFVKGLDPKGNFDHRCINLAVKANEMLDDMCVIEANNGTSLETTFRTEINKPVWTQYYKGIPANKGSKSKLKATAGRMGTKILVDKKLYDDSKDKDAVLADEISGAQEGMKLMMGEAIIYGDLDDEPLGINGLHKHYCACGADSGLDDTDSAHYVFDAFGKFSGTNKASEANLGSIDLVGWAPTAITCFHPQFHNQGGIEITPKRVTDVTDENGNSYEAYQQYFYWNLGIAVRDFRKAGRIANIQRNDMLLATDKGAAFVELIDRLTQRVHDEGVKQALYMDKQVWENVKVLYSRLTRDNAITFAHIEGRKEKRLFGIPVRIQDAMKIKEARVSAVA